MFKTIASRYNGCVLWPGLKIYSVMIIAHPIDFLLLRLLLVFPPLHKNNKVISVIAKSFGATIDNHTVFVVEVKLAGYVFLPKTLFRALTWSKKGRSKLICSPVSFVLQKGSFVHNEWSIPGTPTSSRSKKTQTHRTNDDVTTTILQWPITTVSTHDARLKLLRHCENFAKRDTTYSYSSLVVGLLASFVFCFTAQRFTAKEYIVFMGEKIYSEKLYYYQ